MQPYQGIGKRKKKADTKIKIQKGK